jgi:arylsulfatase A-like enzyme
MRRFPFARTCCAAILAVSSAGTAAVHAVEAPLPNILLLTVDALRADRLSAYGYSRPTSPAIDRLLAQGARFEFAHTIEPLTAPAMASLLSGVPPHQHGATRNGLAVRKGLASWPRILARRGYRTGAFVGNWTLKDAVSGLAAQFGVYEVITSRKRWFGLFFDEADARDLTAAALEWAGEQGEPQRPLLLWTHYVEPHAPYRFHAEFAGRLGIGARDARVADQGRSDAYDTEIAFVDREIERLIEGLRALRSEWLIVFAADHGESLGEHGEWGHGRSLHEPALRIPLGIIWPGRIGARAVVEAAWNTDLAPTVLGLLNLPAHPDWRGQDWSGSLEGRDAPSARGACLQAHKGAVQAVQVAERARRAGLLEVGWMDGRRKEVWSLRSGETTVYDLAAEPAEERGIARAGLADSSPLPHCVAEIRRGLEAADTVPPPALSAELIEGLRSLGYVD